MARKILNVTLSLVIFLTVLTGAAYIMLAKYYEGGFSFNTWINGVYCTGRSVEEVNDELKGRYETRSIEVNEPEGKIEYIFPDEINYRIDFTSYLNNIMEKQNPYLWIKNMKDSVKLADIEPDFSYDEEALCYQIERLSFVKEHKARPVSGVRIKKTERGYELFDDHFKTLNEDMVYDTVRKALYSEDSVVFDDSFLIDPVYTEEELRLINEYKDVGDFLKTRIILDMGAEQIPIDSAVLSEFLVADGDCNFKRNEDGSLYIDEEKIVQYMDDLCSMYDTYDKERVFTTIKGEEKVIKNIYYGTLLDHKAECDYLVNAIKTGITETHIPKYIRQGYVRGLDDIGNTYIEIDMNEQVLYYFEDGMVSLCCDIVSGSPHGYLTPQMVCYVYKKARAATLVGPGYSSYVDYWMAIYQAIGLHDASWQRAYGGTRYLTHGSHGCINMKLKDVEYLYNSVEVGIPVICYY